jgi:hypothetical protein
MSFANFWTLVLTAVIKLWRPALSSFSVHFQTNLLTKQRKKNQILDYSSRGFLYCSTVQWYVTSCIICSKGSDNSWLYIQHICWTFCLPTYLLPVCLCLSVHPSVCLHVCMHIHTHGIAMKFPEWFYRATSGEPRDLIVVKTCLCMFQLAPVGEVCKLWHDKTCVFLRLVAKMSDGF